MLATSATAAPETTFARGLATLYERMPDLASTEVARTHLYGSGEIVFETTNGRNRRWHVWWNSELAEMLPWRDPVLRTKRSGARESVLSYRPGRRLTVTLGSSVIAKYFRASHLERAKHRHLVGHETAVQAGFRAPTLLKDDAHRLLSTKLDGNALSITHHGPSEFREFAVRLRRWQDNAFPADLAQHTHIQELQALDQVARRHARARGTLDRRWTDVRQALVELSASLPREVWSIAHRDLHDGQILVEPGEIGLIDFDTLSVADRCLDVANFLVHVRLRAWQLGSSLETVADHVSAAFTDEVARDQSADYWRCLRFYQVCTCLRLALVYAVRPRWKSLGPNLIALASRCASDGMEANW